MSNSGVTSDFQNVGHPPLVARTTAHESQLTVGVVVVSVSVVSVTVVSVVVEVVEVDVVVTPSVVRHMTL